MRDAVAGDVEHSKPGDSDESASVIVEKSPEDYMVFGLQTVAQDQTPNTERITQTRRRAPELRARGAPLPRPLSRGERRALEDLAARQVRALRLRRTPEGLRERTAVNVAKAHSCAALRHARMAVDTFRFPWRRVTSPTSEPLLGTDFESVLYQLLGVPHVESKELSVPTDPDAVDAVASAPLPKTRTLAQALPPSLPRAGVLGSRKLPLVHGRQTVRGRDGHMAVGTEHGVSQSSHWWRGPR